MAEYKYRKQVSTVADQPDHEYGNISRSMLHVYGHYG